MGGVDKGLQHFRGMPLALHSLMRLQVQTGAIMVNANRNLAAYEAFGAPVWPDALAGYAGPLAGFLSDLALRLMTAAHDQKTAIAMAAAPEDDGKGHITVRPQPVFCLLRTDLLASLLAFTEAGGRKIGAWTAQHPCAIVPFDLAGDDPLAFHNTNTLADLHALESLAGTRA